MENIINIIFYTASGLSVLALVFLWLGEIKFGGRKFIWYHYVPVFLINSALGTAAPYLAVNGIISISVGDNTLLYIILMILWLAVLIASNVTFPVIYRNSDDFSGSFYVCVSFTGICAAAFWIVKLIGLFV